MNALDFEGVFKQTMANCKSLLTLKGGEYAGSEDRLANFKRGAALTGCTALQVLFIYLSKHYDAIASFVQSDAEEAVRPSSEPIESRFDDLINYCILGKALIKEGNYGAIKKNVITGGADQYSDRFRNISRDAVDNLPPIPPPHWLG